MEITEIWQNWFKKRGTHYDFPPPFANKFVGAENNNIFCVQVIDMQRQFVYIAKLDMNIQMETVEKKIQRKSENLVFNPITREIISYIMNRDQILYGPIM